jgi:type II restriction enzyme
VFLVKNAKVINQEIVKETFNKTLFLRAKSKDAKGWILDILYCVDLIKKPFRVLTKRTSADKEL